MHMLQSLTHTSFVQKLQCPVCGGSLRIQSAACLQCTSCNHVFDIVSEVVNLTRPGTGTSELEKIDYDTVHNLNPQSIQSIGNEWSRVLTEAGAGSGPLLEIGSGTGALTEGLYKSGLFSEIVATDISMKFLQQTNNRLEKSLGLIQFVVCDANELPFNPAVFSTVVGRSVLHHLLGFEQTLGRTLQCLKPDGVAIFFEPVLEGKELLAFMAQTLLLSDKSSSEPVLSLGESNRIAAAVRHMTKSAWLDTDKIALIEDKFIFKIDEMKNLASKLGYSSFMFIGQASVDKSYFQYLRNMLIQLQVEPSKIAKFRWIGDAVKTTIGLLRGGDLVAPMGYFVFRK